MRATSTGDGVSSVMSHAPPKFCIHVPTYEMTDAVQSARKIGSASGSSADVDRPSVSLGAGGCAARAGGAGSCVGVTGPIPGFVMFLRPLEQARAAQQPRTHDPGQATVRPARTRRRSRAGGQDESVKLQAQVSRTPLEFARRAERRAGYCPLTARTASRLTRLFAAIRR
jgi:hypothetical protein